MARKANSDKVRPTLVHKTNKKRVENVCLLCKGEGIISITRVHDSATWLEECNHCGGSGVTYE